MSFVRFEVLAFSILVILSLSACGGGGGGTTTTTPPATTAVWDNTKWDQSNWQ